MPPTLLVPSRQSNEVNEPLVPFSLPLNSLSPSTIRLLIVALPASIFCACMPAATIFTASINVADNLPPSISTVSLPLLSTNTVLSDFTLNSPFSSFASTFFTRSSELSSALGIHSAAGAVPSVTTAQLTVTSLF